MRQDLLYVIILILIMIYIPYIIAFSSRLAISPPISYKASSLIRRSLTATIVVVGKKNSVEGWISAGIAEYEKRLRPIMTMNTFFLRNDEELIAHCANARGQVIALDEQGKVMSSKEFAEYLYKSFEAGGASVCFVIGGAEGLPASIRSGYPTISLSAMTWTHQMARLLLIEQIYRATEIRKGSSYHKD